MHKNYQYVVHNFFFISNTCSLTVHSYLIFGNSFGSVYKGMVLYCVIIQLRQSVQISSSTLRYAKYNYHAPRTRPRSFSVKQEGLSLVSKLSSVTFTTEASGIIFKWLGLTEF